MWWVQAVVFAVFAVAAFLVNGWAFPLYNVVLGTGAALMLVLGFWAVPFWFGGARRVRRSLARHRFWSIPFPANPSRLITGSVAVSAAFWLTLNFNFYPRLLDDYQSGASLGHEAMQSNKANDIFYLKDGGRASGFDIATHRLTPTISLEALEKVDRPVLLYVDAEGRERIESRELSPEVLEFRWDYRITRLKWKFLDPGTRAQELKPTYLLRVKPRTEEQQ